MMKIALLLILLGTAASGCTRDSQEPRYKTKRVVLVSVDGPRWSETWGDSSRQRIPYRTLFLLPSGCMVRNFNNNGYTYTNAGHAAMLTGVYQPINNSGQENPAYPNIFQYWRWASGQSAEKTWIISSKDKIEALADTQDPIFRHKFLPMTDCGRAGNGSGYREDSVTLRRALEIFGKHQPILTLVHFREPDYSAHAGDWEGYLAGIRKTDEYLWNLWSYLQQDTVYQGVTTMIVTNDHGRHLDNVAEGFYGHGDGCAGCRQIELLIVGPDVIRNEMVSDTMELIDVPSIISELLYFPLPTGQGKHNPRLFPFIRE